MFEEEGASDRKFTGPAL